MLRLLRRTSSFANLALAIVVMCPVVSSALYAQQPGQLVSGANGGQVSTTQMSSQQTGNPAGQITGGQPNSDQFQIVDPTMAVQAGVARVPQQPFPQLTAQEQDYIDQVLVAWQKKTETVKLFECDFKRWNYNPNDHPTAPVTIASGTLRFSKPDKGMFKVEELLSVADNSPNPKYQINPRREFGEWYICDGDWVHNLDRNDKKAVQTQLPPSMRGKQISMSPLPFLFGVDAAEVKQRYFVRAVPPPEGNSDVWVEAWPKRADDAGNYSRVQVVLDRSDVLPKAMFVFLPNWSNDAKHREVYEFSNKQVNSILDTLKQNLFMKNFVSTKLPADWQVIQEPWVPPTAEPPTQNVQSNQPRTASPGAVQQR